MYRPNHSSTFKIWLIIVEIVYIIAAIIAGFVFKVESFYGKDSFNWGLCIIVWASNFPIFAILYAIYSHLDNQEFQMMISDKILEELKNTQYTKGNTASNPNTVHTTVNSASNTWICPKCDTRNKSSDIQCINCGHYK